MSIKTYDQCAERLQRVPIQSPCTTPTCSEGCSRLPHLNPPKEERVLAPASALVSPRNAISGLCRSFGVRVRLRDTFLQFEDATQDSAEIIGRTDKCSGLIRAASDPDVRGLEHKRWFVPDGHRWTTKAEELSVEEKDKAGSSHHLFSTPIEMVFDSLTTEDLFEGDDYSPSEQTPTAMVDSSALNVYREREENYGKVSANGPREHGCGSRPVSVHEGGQKNKSGISLGAKDDVAMTTVMIRNFPRHLSQQDIIDTILLPRGLIPGEDFDFFYSPMNFRTLQNAGYCFVNFCHSAKAQRYVEFPNEHNLEWTVCWARVQGLSANWNHYKDSPVVQMPEEYRPKWFAEDGQLLDFCDVESADNGREGFSSQECPAPRFIPHQRDDNEPGSPDQLSGSEGELRWSHKVAYELSNFLLATL
ncbi:hypothetical protein Pmar_PMAR009824 [Perkinsus marinus ATCC 50983]|uniref:Uncharacterized protein n=1 Tax=Perkinsus marinus (strain ATCC 50983 / TXsc) TaxID=423536 RepID=C5KV64_PERM5|nr:hypothetical protein Pmar_PMAR009824 [Perkinsus marinus ATCC 50983]EER11610.1 hypothetical protein Pmar_PMAR009824 [Perkinsus marinus ATCC 50983]|eukprot:XP_002779815.1 hypothetical protein Pmar_PMAR009824 [Perkinsus marinus ATCC 50983]